MRLDQVGESSGVVLTGTSPRIRIEGAKQLESVPQTPPLVMVLVLAEPAEKLLSAPLGLQRARLQGGLEQIPHLAARQPGLLQLLGRLA